MDTDDVTMPQAIVADDQPASPGQRTKYASLCEPLRSGLIYHGWYRGFVQTPAFQGYYPLVKRAEVTAQLPEDTTTLIHPTITRDITWWFNVNTIFCKAPDAPETIEQPTNIPIGAEFKPWFYYVKGDINHFVSQFYMTTPEPGPSDPIVTLYETATFSNPEDVNAFFYHPKYDGPLYKVYAASHAGDGDYTDLIIMDCRPRDIQLNDGQIVVDAAVKLYIKNFFGADGSFINMVAICPGGGSKTAWSIHPVGSPVGYEELHELRLTYDVNTDIISAELVQLNFSDLPEGNPIDGKDNTVQTRGASILNKSAEFDRGTETIHECSGGGTVTTANNTAAWTDGVSEDAETYREYRRRGDIDLYYDVLYCQGELWILHDYYDLVTSRIRSYTYEQSGNVDETFVDGSCSKTYSGTANWTKVRTDTYTATETQNIKARSFAGDVNLSTVIRQYDGIYKYTEKWKAENSLSIATDTVNPSKYDHEDSISVNVTGLLGSFTFNDTGDYVGVGPTTLNPDLIGCFAPPSTTSQGQQLSVSGASSNFDFHHSHIPFLGPVLLRTREVTEQGLARTLTEIPEAVNTVLWDQYAYILSSGPLPAIPLGSPIKTWDFTDVSMVGDDWDMDLYPFWADDVQQIKNRVSTNDFPRPEPTDDMPENDYAIWL